MFLKNRFFPLFIVQAFGAFNDNLFKNALVMMITFQMLTLSQEKALFYVNVSAVLFILPYFLFSGIAGQVAEKYNKAKLAQYTKILEVFIALIGSFGVINQNIFISFLALFLLGIQSTFFGPIKYAILPQHLAKDELIKGNGYIEMGTFIAILLGTIMGGYTILKNQNLTIFLFISIAILGWMASFKIPFAPATAPLLKIDYNPISSTYNNLKETKKIKSVWLSILGISWFWAYGGVLITQFPSYVKNVLHGDSEIVTALLVFFSLGIAFGSAICDKLSDKKVEIGLVPFGSIGMAIFGFYFCFAQPAVSPDHLSLHEFLFKHADIWLNLFGLAVFGGFYAVPLYAMLQTRVPENRRSQTIAANNIMNAMWMVLVSIVSAILLKFISITSLFLFFTTAMALVAIYIYTIVPEFLMRFLIWGIIHLMYKIEVRGKENIPDEGAYVVVSNHVSYMDALIIGGTFRRPIKFVMYYKIFKIPILSFIFKTGKAIPIAGYKEDPVLMNKAFDKVSQNLKEGELVGIFPEGALTQDGEIALFKTGIDKIIARDPVDVIPVSLHGMWESMFSKRDSFLRRIRIPRRFRAKIILTIGPPIASKNASAFLLQNVVTNMKNNC